MFNELLMVERGARHAGISMAQRHPDIKDARRMPTALVRLDRKGQVESVCPVPSDVTPWTLRNAQQNSFPFVQPKSPLWASNDNIDRNIALDKKSSQRREALLDLAQDARFNAEAFVNWPGKALIDRLSERRTQLSSLCGTDAESVPEIIDRFLMVCMASDGLGATRMLRAVADELVAGLQQSAQNTWLDVAVAILLGTFDKSASQWKCRGALLFEAAGAQTSIVDPKTVEGVSQALSQNEIPRGIGDETKSRVCALTGRPGRLISGSFPQPNLPVLGQTFLFAKNKDIPANDRYGRFSADAMPVGFETANRLAAAIKALTDEARRGITWRPIPGEAPKKSDLLLAFVEQVPDAPAAGVLARDEDEDFANELSDPTSPDNVDSVAVFEKRAERLIDAVKAKIGADFRLTPVRLAVFRSLDPANRKIVYAGAPSVLEMYDAALAWAAGERNVPAWLTLPVPRKGERRPRPMSAPHVPPLGLIAFGKQIFLRSGRRPEGKNKEQVGLPAAEALGLFFDRPNGPASPAERRVKRILRMVVARRSTLVANVVHIQHTPECWNRRGETMKSFDRLETLRTITVLGILLHKLCRTKEEYMNDAAFKLGQLLAAADVVHAGYCADARGGAVPPSLLGNQVFTTAQTAPVTALAMLCRRWKPYDGWASKAGRDRSRVDAMLASKKKNEEQRGWDIRRAIRQAREMKPLAEELKLSLTGCAVDDAFRAELLLGYIAGLPKAQKEDERDKDHSTPTPEQED